MYSWVNILLQEAALSRKKQIKKISLDEISLFLYIMMSHRSDILG
jgi:hypothetical protein